MKTAKYLIRSCWVEVNLTWSNCQREKKYKNNQELSPRSQLSNLSLEHLSAHIEDIILKRNLGRIGRMDWIMLDHIWDQTELSLSEISWQMSKLSLEPTGIDLFHCWTIEINKRRWLKLRYTSPQQKPFWQQLSGCLSLRSSSDPPLVGAVKGNCMQGGNEFLTVSPPPAYLYLPVCLYLPPVTYTTTAIACHWLFASLLFYHLLVFPPKRTD